MELELGLEVGLRSRGGRSVLGWIGDVGVGEMLYSDMRYRYLDDIGYLLTNMVRQRATMALSRMF